MRAKATTTGPLDFHVRELRRREETDTEEGHGKWWFRSCSKLRLDGGVGSSMRSTPEWLAGETWRLNKCSYVNCVKIQLTVDSALCPVLKVLSPAIELGTTEKHENYSRPVSNDRSCNTQWMDSAVPWVKSVGKLTQSMNGERSSSFSAI